MSGKQLALVIDLNVCVGCHACVTSCKEWNTQGRSSLLLSCWLPAICHWPLVSDYWFPAFYGILQL